MKQLLILILLCVLVGCKSESEPKYITVTPNDGKSYVDVLVDKSMTRDKWECEGDCSAHIAGYSWAKKNGIKEPENCRGQSVSFIHGCETYANEN